MRSGRAGKAGRGGAKGARKGKERASGGTSSRPAWKNGARHWTGNQAGSGLGVSAHSQHVDAALDFLKFLYEPDGYAKNIERRIPARGQRARGPRAQRPALTAALTTAIVPILVVYVVLQRWYVAGLTAAAVKG